MSEYAIDTCEDFEEKLELDRQYSGTEVDQMKEFYTENYAEEDLKEDVLDALESSTGEGLRDTQLLAILSSPKKKDCGGEKIEEDCRVGEQPYLSS